MSVSFHFISPIIVYLLGNCKTKVSQLEMHKKKQKVPSIYNISMLKLFISAKNDAHVVIFDKQIRG